MALSQESLSKMFSVLQSKNDPIFMMKTEVKNRILNAIKNLGIEIQDFYFLTVILKQVGTSGSTLTFSLIATPAMTYTSFSQASTGM